MPKVFRVPGPEDVVAVRLNRPLTTGQISKIVGVAPRTVSVWIDSGKIKGYRIPGSEDRRVAVPDLVAFLRKSGMPVPPELVSFVEPVALVYGLLPGEVVPGAVACPTLLELGESLATVPLVRAVVLGDSDGQTVVRGAAKAARARHPHAQILVAANGDWVHDPACAADEVFRRPFDWADLVAALTRGREPCQS